MNPNNPLLAYDPRDKGKGKGKPGMKGDNDFIDLDPGGFGNFGPLGGFGGKGGKPDRPGGGGFFGMGGRGFFS